MPPQPLGNQHRRSETEERSTDETPGDPERPARSHVETERGIEKEIEQRRFLGRRGPGGSVVLAFPIPKDSQFSISDW